MDRLVAAKELSFRIGFTGHSGHLTIEPLPPVERDTPHNSIPDFILVSFSVTLTLLIFSFIKGFIWYEG